MGGRPSAALPSPALSIEAVRARQPRCGCLRAADPDGRIRNGPDLAVQLHITPGCPAIRPLRDDPRAGYATLGLALASSRLPILGTRHRWIPLDVSPHSSCPSSTCPAHRTLYQSTAVWIIAGLLLIELALRAATPLLLLSIRSPVGHTRATEWLLLDRAWRSPQHRAARQLSHPRRRGAPAARGDSRATARQRGQPRHCSRPPRRRPGPLSATSRVPSVSARASCPVVWSSTIAESTSHLRCRRGPALSANGATFGDRLTLPEYQRAG